MRSSSGGEGLPLRSWRMDRRLQRAHDRPRRRPPSRLLARLELVHAATRSPSPRRRGFPRRASRRRARVAATREERAASTGTFSVRARGHVGRLHAHTMRAASPPSTRGTAGYRRRSLRDATTSWRIFRGRRGLQAQVPGHRSFSSVPSASAVYRTNLCPAVDARLDDMARQTSPAPEQLD